jgi:hypothetical protein
MLIHFTWFANIFQTTLPKNPNPSQKILPSIDPFPLSTILSSKWQYDESILDKSSLHRKSNSTVY